MKRHDTVMSTDGFERDLAQALREEAYRVPHHLTAGVLERRLERTPRQLAPPRRWLAAAAAVLVLAAVVVGAPLVAPSFLPGSGGPPSSEGCEVSSEVPRGPGWTEIGAANVFFNASTRRMNAGESYVITARFDPDAATGYPVGMHAERMGSGERVDAEAYGRIDPATHDRTPLPPIPSLPGTFYAFAQPLPAAGCWRLVGTIDGRPVGSAVVEVGAEVIPMPGGPTPSRAVPTPGQ